MASLLTSIQRHCGTYRLETVITLNIEEDLPCCANRSAFPLTIRKNSRIKGFGENHNSAFNKNCRADYFCVLNPDIRFLSNPFPALLETLADPGIGVVGPSLVDSGNRLQDSMRKFPTPMEILFRRLKKSRAHNFPVAGNITYPDWIAGMFMLFPSRIFASLGGFDEGYFMYCEDADICMRLRRLNLRTACRGDVTAIHDPRRESHRRFPHFLWHVRSLSRFFRRWHGYQG